MPPFLYYSVYHCILNQIVVLEGIKKVELREFKYQERIVKGRVKFVSQNYTPAKFACPVQTAKFEHLSMVLQVKQLCPL